MDSIILEPKGTPAPAPQGTIENVTFAELRLGQSASLSRHVTQEDVELFATVSGDVNPAHLDAEYADAGMFHGVVAHGMLGGSLFSTLLGTKLPGPGTIYLGQDLRFRRPVKPGDTITATVTVASLDSERNRVVLDCRCLNQEGREVILGTAEVIAPTEKVRRAAVTLPEVRVIHHDYSRRLIAQCRGLEPVRTAIAHPCDRDSLLGALEAAKAGLIRPILVGPLGRMTAIAEAEGLDLSGCELVHAEHSHGAAALAVELARTGSAQAIMKGSLHTDELMGEVVSRQGGLRTARRVSHAYVMSVPTYAKPLIVTDAAINIAPDLAAKADIAQNAIDLARALGVALPKVAILSAVETVNARMQSTLDAAALCKMADRGQIRGGLLDGPLALDNAISHAAAATKGIVSPVAGDPDILLVPNLEAGNMLAKQLSFLASADAAGIVLGARVPVVLTSRADSVQTRLASCAIMALVAANGSQGHE
ncbi:MAG TPA: bifunctional enoyl-CoA hydratase/phosphate acetyltransferase [Azospirillaceae bacterium]|nr:bifunctional enoyl-CoA hydratase/phosphate acetyltransferase [Azospirillaceae bacterium]